MSRPYDRMLAVEAEERMVRIELTLVRNSDVKVFPLYLTPFEAGQLVGMLPKAINEVLDAAVAV
jgi:hypothetical protein